MTFTWVFSFECEISLNLFNVNKVLISEILDLLLTGSYPIE